LISSSKKPQEDGQRGTSMYHVVNLSTTSWSTLAPAFLAQYPSSTEMKTVPFDEWIGELSRTADELIDPERNPAVKLLDFYRGASRAGQGARVLASQKAEQASKTLTCVGAVDEEWVGIWMQHWGFKVD